MASSGDEMADAIGAAVSALLTQKGDLRDEITGIKNEQPSDNLANMQKKFEQDKCGPDLNVNLPNRISNSRNHSRHENNSLFPPPYDLSHASSNQPLHGVRNDNMDQFPERRTYHAFPSPPQFAPNPFYLRDRRYIEKYDSERISDVHQHPITQLRPPLPKSPPRDFRVLEEHRRRDVILENMKRREEMGLLEQRRHAHGFAIRNEPMSLENQIPVRSHLPPPPHNERSPPRSIWPAPVHRSKSAASLMYAEQNRRRSPSRLAYPPRSTKRRPKVFSKSTRSRVNSEDKEKEESFDYILLQHKKSQRELKAGPVGISEDGSSRTSKGEPALADIESRIKQFRTNAKSNVSKEETLCDSPVSANPSAPPSTVNIEGKLYAIDEIKQAILQNPIVNQLGRIKPTAEDSTTTINTPSIVTAEGDGNNLQEKSDSDRDVSFSGENDVECAVEEESMHEDSIDNKENQDVDSSTISINQEEPEDDEDEDEELLKLRLAALHSAYNRNIDFANDEGTNPQEEEPQEREIENKPKKKKTKQQKEKKKMLKKDASSSAPHESRSSTRESKNKSDLRKFPNLSNREIKSPPKDLSDPKVLTLGNMVMRQKVKKEQVLLQDIRKMGNADEGAKLFMDLINSKNKRDKKKQKKSTETGSPKASSDMEIADNYDEVEMEVEDTNEQVDNIVQENHTFAVGFQSSVADNCEQPRPPGTEEDVDDLTPNQTVSQESIWELLDKPLENEEPSPEENMTAADKLIMSIRAKSSIPSTSNKASESKPASLEEAKADSFKIKTSNSPRPARDDNADYENADSPYDFQHAFEAPVADAYPAIATDLSCAEQENWTISSLDADPPQGKRNASEDLRTVQTRSAVSVKNELNSETGRSFEDEDELRERLLHDLALKRASAQLAPHQETDVVAIPDANTIISKRSIRLLNQKFRNARAEKQKAAKQRKRINRALKIKLRKERKRERLLENVAAPVASPNSAAVPQTLSEFIKPQVITATGNSTAPTPPIASSSRRVVTEHKSDPFKLRIQTSSSFTTATDVKKVSYPSRAQLSKVNMQPRRPATPKPTKGNNVECQQRMVHPPVVISHEFLSHSSDEDETTPATLYKRDVQSSSSSPNKADFSVAHLSAESSKTSDVSARRVALSLKRKLAAETSTEAKHNRPNHENDPLESGCSSSDFSTAIVNDRSEELPLKVDQRFVVVKQTESTKALTDAKNKVNSDLVETEGKLRKVCILLGHDDTSVTRLQQEKRDKGIERQRLQVEAESLKRKLMENEKNIAMVDRSLYTLEKESTEALGMMKKRRTLETKFLKRIEELSNEKARLDAMTPPLISNEKSTPATLLHDSASRNRDTQTRGFDAHVKEALKKHPVRRVAKNLQKRESLLRQEVEREKAKLRQAEMKLKLIKHSKQPTKSRLVSKSLKNARASSATVIYSAKTQLQPAPLVSTSIPVTYPSAPRASQQTACSSLNLQDQTEQTRTDRLAKKAPLQVTIVEPTSESTKSDEKPKDCVSNHETPMEAAGNERSKDNEDEITPVTPTLKKRRSSRRSSSSSVTSPGVPDVGSLSAPVVADNDSGLPLWNAQESNDLKKKLPDFLLRKIIKQCEDDKTKYTSLVHLCPVPACFSNWSVNVGEIARQTDKLVSKKENRHSLPKTCEYESPLKCFRSYRLSANFSRQNVNISSPTFSHRIHADQILCRYDLNGKCQDVKCRAQHFKDLNLSPSEIYLDLLWYCPTLLKTNDGKQVTSLDSLDVQLKAADETVAKLCNTGSKADNANRSVEATCTLLIGIINRALGSKDPHTTILKRRRVRMQPTFNDDVDDGVTDDAKMPLFQESFDLEDLAGHEPEVRYYDEDDKHKSEIERLLSLVDQHPEDERMRIELVNAYLDQPSKNRSGENRSIELALHTLCVGIERNEQSEALWSAYVPAFRRHRNGDTSNENNELDIFDQILNLLPLSKPIWNEIFKWRWPLEKLDAFYQDLIENLITRKAIWELEENAELASHKESFSYYSSWLLHVILERCHLLQQARSKIDAKNALLTTLSSLNNIRNSEKNGGNVEFPLSQEDTIKLWLVYIHFVEFGIFPSSLYNHSLSSHMFGIVVCASDVILPFSASRKLVHSPSKLRELFKAAHQCSEGISNDPLVDAQCKLQLYRSLVKLEASLDNWEAVSACCENILKEISNLVNDESLVDLAYLEQVWEMWLEAIILSKDTVLITQTFEKAITSCPRSAKLAYMSALYQLNSENPDMEAATSYLANCIASLIQIEDKDDLSPFEVQQYYRRLLKHEISLQSSSRVNLIDGITSVHIEKEKPYLWLIYCLLVDLLLNQQDEDLPKNTNVNELYEAALHVVSSTEDRKAIWIQYLLYVRSTASALEGEGFPRMKSNVHARQAGQLAWFKRFTLLVRRCLMTTPAIRGDESSAIEGIHTDYTFHNEVCSIYLGCFKKNQLPVAMTILTDTMPTNLPLLSKCALIFLRNEDFVSVLSLLWRVTSSYSGANESCKDYKLWKIAATALVAEGKHKKAILLYKRALTILPRCRILWHDVAALTLAYGDSSDLKTLNDHCVKYLGESVRSLLKDLPV